MVVTATPPQVKGPPLDPESHVRIEGGEYARTASSAGPTVPAALWRAAPLLARQAFSARVGPLERALAQAGDPSWG